MHHSGLFWLLYWLMFETNSSLTDKGPRNIMEAVSNRLEVREAYIRKFHMACGFSGDTEPYPAHDNPAGWDAKANG